MVLLYKLIFLLQYVGHFFLPLSYITYIKNFFKGGHECNSIHKLKLFNDGYNSFCGVVNYHLNYQLYIFFVIIF